MSKDLTDEQRANAVPLHEGPELNWTYWYRRFVRELIDNGQDDGRGDKAMDLYDKMLAGANAMLPDGCWWAPGAGAGIYGQPGTELPDVKELLEAAFAGVAR